MTLRSVSLAVLAGVASFLVVTAVVSELLLPWIEFSVFVGIPAGLVSGLLVAAGVYLGLASDPPERRRRVALAVAGASATFLVTILLAVVVFDVGAALSLAACALLGVVGGAVVYLRTGRADSALAAG